jgi:hypothetical protein
VCGEAGAPPLPPPPPSPQRGGGGSGVARQGSNEDHCCRPFPQTPSPFLVPWLPPCTSFTPSPLLLLAASRFSLLPPAPWCHLRPHTFTIPRSHSHTPTCTASVCCSYLLLSHGCPLDLRVFSRGHCLRSVRVPLPLLTLFWWLRVLLTGTQTCWPETSRDLTS